MTASVAPERVAGLDPRLPGLDELFDTRRVAALFARAWRAEVVDCRQLGTRYDPGAGCVATYALATDAAPHTIGVVELTPDERRIRSYVDDPDLPGLAAAADAERVAGVLGSGPITVVPVRYRPGQRAVLRYESDRPTGRVVLFGKVVRSGVADLAATFVELHERARTGAGPSVPAPTAVDETLGLLVLPAVGGRSLHALVFDPTSALMQRNDGFRIAGDAVARLHDGPPPPRSVALSDDIRELDPAADALRALEPGLAEQWTSVLIELGEVCPGSAGLVASHGALRTDQVVLGPDGPVLLDLDGFCAAPRARDLGNLLAYLRWRAMRRPEDTAVVAEGRGAVREGYGKVAPVPDDELGCYEALSLLKIAARRYRNLDVAEWALVPDLIEAAAALVAGGR